mmetsp:Transcript_47248/g.75456  ORF Transcript_47248/g.75456 Transcript_47248/m.75456 type:complete len:214 (+) Transcript_47248:124-765(+)
MSKPWPQIKAAITKVVIGSITVYASISSSSSVAKNNSSDDASPIRSAMIASNIVHTAACRKVLLSNVFANLTLKKKSTTYTTKAGHATIIASLEAWCSLSASAHSCNKCTNPAINNTTANAKKEAPISNVNRCSRSRSCFRSSNKASSASLLSDKSTFLCRHITNTETITSSNASPANPKTARAPPEIPAMIIRTPTTSEIIMHITDTTLALS